MYCSTERRGFDVNNTFHVMFKTYKEKKNIEGLGKNPQNYENARDETYVYEQKPIKMDDFKETEGKKVKEHIEKRQINRREVAEKNKLLKKKKKQEENKKTEKKMWNRLKGLNQ